jgi:hypothetical protein
MKLKENVSFLTSFRQRDQTKATAFSEPLKNDIHHS